MLNSEDFVKLSENQVKIGTRGDSNRKWKLLTGVN